MDQLFLTKMAHFLCLIGFPFMFSFYFVRAIKEWRLEDWFSKVLNVVVLGGIVFLIFKSLQNWPLFWFGGLEEVKLMSLAALIWFYLAMVFIILVTGAYTLYRVFNIPWAYKALEIMSKPFLWFALAVGFIVEFLFDIPFEVKWYYKRLRVKHPFWATFWYKPVLPTGKYAKSGNKNEPKRRPGVFSIIFLLVLLFLWRL